LSDRRRRIDIPVGVKYGSDPEQVQKILVDAVSDHPACLEDPPPKALFREFGDSALNFELRFWTPDAEARLDTMSEVSISVDSALKAAGIEIPFPQRDLHLKSIPDQGVEVTRKA
jgi:potassium efflux system protein